MALTAARPSRKKPQTHIPTESAEKARLSVDLTPEMMAALKVRAAVKRTTIKKLIVNLIDQELER